MTIITVIIILAVVMLKNVRFSCIVAIRINIIIIIVITTILLYILKLSCVITIRLIKLIIIVSIIEATIMINKI
jgi:hypothetical protein